MASEKVKKSIDELKERILLSRHLLKKFSIIKQNLRIKFVLFRNSFINGQVSYFLLFFWKTQDTFFVKL